MTGPGLPPRRVSAPVAARQARWIAALEPWRGLGYRPAALARFLARSARARHVWIVASGRGPRARVLGVMVLQPGVLLGSFVSLLAVRPEAAGQGLGRTLMAAAEAATFTERRWLYTSADADNRAALAFYRKLGFARVGVLPDLVRAGRREILLRKRRP